MYKLKDLDEPTKLLAVTIENLQNGKEYFPLVVMEVLKQVIKIQEILMSIQKNLTGESTELIELLKRISDIDALSVKFNRLLDIREAELMRILPKDLSPILPS
jgi:hypothetical protein